jgi:hypothetical protein
MKEAILLLAIERSVGGVKVKHQFFGRGLETLDELLDQDFMQLDGDRTATKLLQST